jgi:VanZ family protein
MQTWRLVLLWTVTAAWAAQIFAFSTATFGGVFTTWLLTQSLALFHLTVSHHTFILLHHLMRKSAHVTEYGLFSMLLYLSLVKQPQVEWRKWMALWSVAIAGIYSLTDEFHQRLVPGRGPSLRDCGIDTLGACLGMLLVYVAYRLSTRKRAPSPPVIETEPVASD